MQRVARIAKANERIEAAPKDVAFAACVREEDPATMLADLMLARLLELNLAREGV